MMKKPKLISSIRAKLFSAVAMLLVAAIMVVSSTYAWFTLSTAPEVTGMSTSIGANGSLEMALRYSNDEGQAQGVRDGVLQADDDSNTYWGNLVDLDNDLYGLSSIILYPSALNTEGMVEGQFSAASILQTPVYGADGRVSELDSNTMIGTYFNTEGKTGFYENDLLGVRAIGTSSGLSDRQLAYRNAIAAAATAMSQAKTYASTSLVAHGNGLSSLAVELAMSANAACTAEDVQKIAAVLTELDKSVAKLDEAYKNAVLAYAASALVTGDTWQTVKEAMAVEGSTAAAVITAFGGEETLPDGIKTGYTQYKGMITDLEEAHTKLETAGTTLASSDVKAALSCIINPDQMKINNMTVSEVKADISNFANTVLNSGGIIIQIMPGGGFYADIADQCGNFQANVVIDELSYNGTTVTNVKATMKTSATAPHAATIATELTDAGQPSADEGEEAKPMTEFYGYVIDLAFRTNASSSNLLLQTEATDRIYEGNSNELTQGSGSVMKFTSATSDLAVDQIKELMRNIRIVFFKTEAVDSAYTIIKTAELDVDNGSFTATGYEARVILSDGTDEIMPLNQNEQTNISVLVYLDGQTIENADVAATASASLVGSLNLQFASDANLVPMENGDLNISGGSGSSNGSDSGSSDAGSSDAGNSDEGAGE